MQPYADYEVNDGTEEAQEYFADIEKQLSALDAEMAALNKVGEKLSDIRPGDVLATATLSPEARGVYHHLLSEMGKGNKDVKKSARVSALLAARMTDRLVALHREAGDKDYTAMDALPELLANAGETAQEKEAAQLRQEEIRTQKEAVRKQYEGTAMWMKAPNGKDTNLTEEQWLLVRTPAFKAWFGDWEVANALAFALHGTPVTSITGKEFQSDGVKLTDKVPKWYAENFNGSVSHPELGEVKLDLEGVKDSLGHGMGKEKAAAYAAVPYIIQHGIVYDRQSNWKQRGFDTAVIIAPVEIGGEKYAGEVVVKRLPNRQGFYLHEVEVQKKLERAFKTSTKGGARQASKLIIAQKNDIVNTASKVVDENGEPLVVYHGSDAQFDVFDKTKGRANMDIQGMFFSPWEIDAQGYGGHVRAFFLNIKNPANEGQGYKALNRYAGQNYAGIKAREDLIANGYDGVNNDGEEFIAFEPTQIKSVDNNGNFSADDPNIYHQAIKQEIKGNYDQAQAIIRLFEGADPSTFMHEMSHHYLSELAKLAQMFPESEAAKDYETIMQWASWQEGQAKAYAGTASAKEFQARDEAIRKAEKAGDTLEVKHLKDVWAQERFARAFEEYLHSGDAPIFLSRLCGG